MSEWAAAFIADGPRKVRALALANFIDGLGYQAALRNFGRA